MFRGIKYLCNIWRKTDLFFQKQDEEFNKFSPEHVKKSKNWDFDEVFLFIAENNWASILQGKFASWQWWMMQNLKRNSLVSSKFTWGVWRILALSKMCTLMGFFWTKYIIFELKKSTGELSLMVLNIDATFDGKVTCSFKNDMRNLANFYHKMLGNLKIGTLMRYFYWNYKVLELKFYRGVLRHDSQEWCKIRIGIDLSVQNWHEEFDQFWHFTCGNHKNFHFNGLLLNKVYVWAEKSIGELRLMELNIDATFDG